MIFHPDNDWVPPHRVLDIGSAAMMPMARAALDQPVPFVRPFTLAQHFVRGGYVGSLFAGSSLRSKQWRERWLRADLPLLPLDQREREIDPGVFWPLLAELNGQGLGKLQRALALDNAALARAMGIARQRGLTFELPYWSPPDCNDEQSPLNYWSDSGLAADLQRRLAFPTRVKGWDEKRWEGFVIATLAGAAGPSVRARGYREGQDEIDLVLDWPESRRPWAIEISASPRKRLSPGNWRAFDETEAERMIVVDGGPERRGFGKRGEEPMRLIEALRAVRAGP